MLKQLKASHKENLLINKNFLLIWSAGLISGLSLTIYVLIEQWYILHFLDLNKYLGLLMMATTLPRVLLMAFGGVLADRKKKTTIVSWSLYIRFGLLLLMALLFQVNLLQLTPLFLFAILFGGLDAFFWPARDALLPTMVKKEHLFQANASIQTTNQISMVLGPVIGAFLLDTFSYSLCFLIVACFLLIGGLIISSIKESAPPIAHKTNTFKDDLLGGFQYIKNSSFLLTIMVTFVITNLLFIGPMMLSIPLYADEKFGADSSSLSILQSSFAFGLLLGALAMGFLNINRKRGYLLIGIICSEGLLLFSYSQLPLLWISSLLLFLIGVCISSINIPVVSLIQEKVEKDKLGRVMSLNTMVSMGLIPVSYALVSWMLNYINISTILAYASFCIVIFSFMLIIGSKSLKNID